MRSCNFKHLYYFTVIAREGSVTKASKKLHITQPTLSGQLAQLEEFLGRKLFDRKNKKLILNRVGQKTLSYASEIFKLQDEMMESVKQDSQNIIERVFFGVSPSLSKSHIYDFINPLLLKENLQMYVKEGQVVDLLQELKGGTIDIVLCDRHILQEKKYFTAERLLSRKIVVVGHPKFKHLQKNFPESLHQKPFVTVSKDSHLHEEIQYYFASHNISPHIFGQMDDIVLLRIAAESGNVCTALPYNAVKESIQEKKLVVIGEMQTINSEMWIIQRKTDQSSLTVAQNIKNFKKNQK